MNYDEVVQLMNKNNAINYNLWKTKKKKRMNEKLDRSVFVEMIYGLYIHREMLPTRYWINYLHKSICSNQNQIKANKYNNYHSSSLI